jgi:hypothetical protein
MDLLSAVFLGCFVFGFVAALASFVLGGDHGIHLGGHHLDLGAGHGHLGGVAHGDLAIGHAGHAVDGAGHGGGAHGAADGLFPLNPTTALTFLTWFGGAGFVLHNFYHVVAVASLAIAGLAGLFGAGIVFLFLLKVIVPNQALMREADYDPVGSVGRVSVAIRDEGLGEVVYARGGTRRSAGARSLDGQALERGTEVVIAKYDRGVAYVQPWTEFVSPERRRPAAEGND